MVRVRSALKLASLLVVISFATSNPLFFDVKSKGGINAAERVRVDVYYETLCPDSIRFIEKQLWPTFKALHPSGIMDVFLYAYGNAKQVFHGGLWKFKCQHGDPECLLNTLETCVEFTHPKPEIFLPFIRCVEKNATVEQARQCSKKYRLSWESIYRCTKGGLGNSLEHVMGLKTDALNPKHTFIPWIVVNGESDANIQKGALNNLKQLVCSKYTGDKPEPCSK